ncbi:MAG: hypothetical protein R3Y29_01640 [bacterium]
MSNPISNQMEVNSIRECAVCHITSSAKLAHFASNSTDSELKDMLTNLSCKCEQSAQKLIEFL